MRIRLEDKYIIMFFLMAFFLCAGCSLNSSTPLPIKNLTGLRFGMEKKQVNQILSGLHRRGKVDTLSRIIQLPNGTYMYSLKYCYRGGIKRLGGVRLFGTNLDEALVDSTDFNCELIITEYKLNEILSSDSVLYAYDHSMQFDSYSTLLGCRNQP